MDGEAVLATMLGTGGGLAPWSFTWAFSEEDGDKPPIYSH